MAQTKLVNPWTWQDGFGFSQAIDVRQGGRVLYCAGQTSVDASGAPLHAGDMAAQITQAFDNLETVLKAAGLTLGHVVRLNYYTRDVPAFLQAAGAFGHAVAGRGRAARRHAARRGLAVPPRHPGGNRSHRGGIGGAAARRYGCASR